MIRHLQGTRMAHDDRLPREPFPADGAHGALLRTVLAGVVALLLILLPAQLAASAECPAPFEGADLP
jgi:hypothetical protein